MYGDDVCRLFLRLLQNGLLIMKNGIKSPTFRIALCGIIAALGLALMMITSIVPIGTYAFPCFAGIFISAIVIEYGSKWAIGVFISVSVLSAFLAGDKEAVLYFIMLFGYYPIIKGLIERKIKNKAVQYILKLAVFNAAAVLSFYAGMFLLSIKPEEYTIFGMYIPLLFLAIGNLFFILYDFAVTVFITQYVCRLRGKIFGKR